MSEENTSIPVDVVMEYAKRLIEDANGPRAVQYGVGVTLLEWAAGYRVAGLRPVRPRYDTTEVDSTEASEQVRARDAAFYEAWEEWYDKTAEARAKARVWAGVE